MMIHSVRRVIFRRSCLQERTGPKHNTTGSQPDFVGSCTNMLMDSNAFKAGLKDALQKQAMDLGRNSSSSPGASSSPSPSASCSSTRSESHVACLKSAKCTDIIGSVTTHHKAVTQLDCLSDKKWQAFLTLSLASFRQALLSSRGAPTAWPSSSGPESSSGGGKRRWQASGTKPQKFCNTAICLTHGATFVHLFIAGTEIAVSNLDVSNSMPFATLASLSAQQPRQIWSGTPGMAGWCCRLWLDKLKKPFAWVRRSFLK